MIRTSAKALRMDTIELFAMDSFDHCYFAWAAIRTDNFPWRWTRTPASQRHGRFNDFTVSRTPSGLFITGS